MCPTEHTTPHTDRMAASRRQNDLQDATHVSDGEQNSWEGHSMNLLRAPCRH